MKLFGYLGTKAWFAALVAQYSRSSAVAAISDGDDTCVPPIYQKIGFAA
jgi:hypothetical protein